MRLSRLVAILCAVAIAAIVLSPRVEAAELCPATQLLRFNHHDDFQKYRGAKKSNGKFVGKLKIEGTDSCTVFPYEDGTGPRYSCFSGEMSKNAVISELQSVISDLDGCLKSPQFKKQTARDTRSTVLATTWVANGMYITVSGDHMTGEDWYWSITVAYGEP